MKEVDTHPIEDIIDGELVGKVLIKRGRLHAYHASDLVEIESSQNCIRALHWLIYFSTF
jgi:hypothetical protein